MSIMACTRLFGLPISMGRLTNLTELDLRETKLVTPPKVVQAWETEDILDYLARYDEADRNGVLDLVDIGLAAIPVEVTDLTGFTELSLAGNTIAELPNDFAYLSNLVDINLDRNRIQNLPMFMMPVSYTHLTLPTKRIV